MLSILRILSKLSIYLLIFLTLVAIFAIMFVNPNNFKPEANSLLKKYTGYNFEITGPITWTFSPMSFSAQDIKLNEPAINIKSAKIFVDPYSILSNTLVVESLELNGVVANLPTLAPINLKIPNQLNLKEAIIQDSVFAVKNSTNNQNWELRNANITAKNIVSGASMSAVPINVTGTLVNLNNNASLDINTVINIDENKQTVTLNPVNINWNDAKAYGTALISKQDNNVTGNITLEPVDLDEILKKLDPYYANSKTTIENVLQAQAAYSFSFQEQILDLSNLSLNLDDGALNGTLKFGMLSPYKASFDLTADKMNFQPLIILTKALFPSTPPKTLLPIELLKQISVLGKFSGSNLRINDDFSVDNLSAQLAAEDGLIQLGPINISAYGGTHNISAYIDCKKEVPSIKLNDTAEGVNIEEWSKLLNLPKIIAGSAHIKISLDATGNSIAELQQSATGGINLEVARGTLYGIDINKLMEYTTETLNEVYVDQTTNKNISLQDLIKPKITKWFDAQKNNPLSGFDSFTFKADIDKGVAQASLSFNSQEQDLVADGQFTLGSNEINFKGQISDKAELSGDIKQIADAIQLSPMPILITGTFSKPFFNPNLEAYASDILKQTDQALIKVAASSMVAVSPAANDKSSKSASDLFMDALKGLSK